MQASSSIWSGRYMALLLATFAYFLTMGIMLPILPVHVKVALHGGGREMGLVIGAFGFSALLFRPLAGYLGDRFGRRPIAVGGAFIVALSVFMYSQCTTVATLSVARFITGIGEAFVFVAVLSMISDIIAPQGRGRAFNFFTIALYAGMSVGPLAGEFLYQQYFTRYVWLFGAATAASAGAIFLLLGETNANCGGRPRIRLIHPAALRPGLILIASVFGLAGFNAFVPLYAKMLHLSGSALLFAVFACALIATRILGAGLPERLGNETMTKIALACSAGGLVLIGLSNSLPMVLAATLVFSVGQAFAFPVLTAIAVAKAGPSDRAAVLATFSAFLDAGFCFSPMILGLIADHVRLETIFFICAAVSMAGLIGIFRAAPAGVVAH
ncbi:MFS transporter [Massilia sp. P8910]|uniref:MFS transporter n=1 Tax=Massilia antarctica TaxID=2765360 RepID=UPI001E37D998|nr:MFS transporter [Massilia antarctica]MCE3602808.1 MFS transporter [Massilia antarctica]